MNEQNNELEMIPESEENKENLPEAQAITEIQDNTEENLTPVEVEPEIPVEAPAPTEQPEERPIWSFAAQVEADRAAAKKRGMRGALVYAIIMTCLFAVCFAILAVLLLAETDKHKQPSGSINIGTFEYVSISDLVATASKTIITVSANTTNGTVSSSGYICSNDGYIITTSDAIADADTVSIVLPDGNKYMAEVIETDPDSGVAVLYASELAYDSIGDISKPDDVSVVNGHKNLPALVDYVIGSVVTVRVTTAGGTGFGSGFVYTNSGYIITNYHVIDGAKKITVICTDGRELEAKLIDGDELSDVAVIFVKNLGITSLPVGDSDKLRVGEDVIAIGTPNDIEYAGTVTKGIISGVKRKVRVYEEEGYLSKTMEMIQTDTTLNHGNSGGPLINMRGEVIGINTMKYYASDAGDTLYFSIPINDAVEIADDIIEDGKYSGDKGSSTQGVQLGIQCLTVYKGIEIEIDENTKFTPEADGVLVIMVNEGYSAYGKLNPLDIIVSFSGVETPTIEKMRAELFKHKVGDTVTIEVWRDGKIVTVDITL